MTPDGHFNILLLFEPPIPEMNPALLCSLSNLPFTLSSLKLLYMCEKQYFGLKFWSSTLKG